MSSESFGGNVPDFEKEPLPVVPEEVDWIRIQCEQLVEQVRRLLKDQFIDLQEEDRMPVLELSDGHISICMEVILPKLFVSIISDKQNIYLLAGKTIVMIDHINQEIGRAVFEAEKDGVTLCITLPKDLEVFKVALTLL